MASSYLTLNILLILPLLFSLSSSAVLTPPGTPISAANVCNSTQYPSFCRSQLPNNNSTANVYDYGRFSVRKSLSAAEKFSALINKYLSRRSVLTKGAISALEDCRFLADLNLDFIKSTFQTVNGTKTNLSTVRMDEVQTMLSAILTNTQTCLDGIQTAASTWSSKNGVLAPLDTDTKLYSLSLSLFNRGWVPKKKRTASHSNKRQLDFTNGLPLKMSRRNLEVLQTVNNRRLLQSSEQVVVHDVVVVSQDGSGNFTTITDAVAAAPNKTNSENGYFLIYVTAGVYEEYVMIIKNKRNIMMIGDGINQTIITGNRNVVDGWTTFNSYSFAVVGQGFVGVNMTFRNTAGAIKHQAVAVRNGADLSAFYSCSFEGYQDTLYVHSLRQFYRDCDIYGTVDFIFGNAASLFQNCNIYPRLPMRNQFNAITAQGRTDPGQNTGICMQNCTITAAEDLATSDLTIQTYLGRPWKEYSRTVYIQSFLDGVVQPVGWREWSGDFALNTSYYAEFDNYGSGADTSQRVTWPGFYRINATDAANFVVSTFIFGDEWLPQTGVPYYGGL